VGDVKIKTLIVICAFEQCHSWEGFVTAKYGQTSKKMVDANTLPQTLHIATTLYGSVEVQFSFILHSFSVREHPLPSRCDDGCAFVPGPHPLGTATSFRCACSASMCNVYMRWHAVRVCDM
jgi:hypothetical protein